MYVVRCTAYSQAQPKKAAAIFLSNQKKKFLGPGAFECIGPLKNHFTLHRFAVKGQEKAAFQSPPRPPPRISQCRI